MRGIRLLIFDLDMCVFDTDTQRPTVIAAMEHVLGSFDLPEGLREQAMADIRSHASPIEVAQKYDFPAHVRDAIQQRYRNIHISPDARTYGDEHHIAALQIESILVTAGFLEVQYRKIKHTGVNRLFSEIYVDVISEDGSHRGKQAIFEEIMETRGLDPWQIVVLGDNPKTELGAGKNLGMHTVQTLRPGIVHWEKAEHHINTFAELASLLKKIDEQENAFA